MANVVDSTNSVTSNMFQYLATPRDLQQYTLMRGVPDFSNLKQFNNYEKGFPYLIVVSIPEFLKRLAKVGSAPAANSNSLGLKIGTNNSLANLINNYVHILEYDFKGLDSGIEQLSTETQEVTNGLQSINVITKTTGITSTNFSMRYTEKVGEPITKVHELYLRSIRDPASGFKTYGGLIGMNDSNGYKDLSEVGFEQETFSFLYLHTDNTGLQLTRAVYFVGCQPTSSDLTIYNAERGTVEFAEVSAEFTGFPIMGAAVNKRAQSVLDWINSESNTLAAHRNSWVYDYAAASDSGILASEKLKSNKTGIDSVESSATTTI